MSFSLVSSSQRNPWAEDVPKPVFEVENGIAALEILVVSFKDFDPIWKYFVVGYFIGDTPHVRSIHAIVNNIWVISGSKVDSVINNDCLVLFW